MRKVYSLVLFIVISVTALSQSGKIAGKVINATSGLPLGNATVTLVEKSQMQMADQNGAFTFGRLAAGTYSIRCSYVGHIEKIIEDIIVKNDEVSPITISLDEKKADSGVFFKVVRVKAAGETVSSLLIAQKNSANVSDGISAETIKKTPDKSAGDVLKRVSGASIQDERFAIIRGLNDRYNAAFINGAPLPSTESDRKAFAFDIFPAAILDNLIIYKTATPDKSGEFAGGLIDITTKSILPKSFTSISFGGSYNSLITGKNRYYSEVKGRKDWMGIDDGARSLPAGLPSARELSGMTFAQRAEAAKFFGNYKWGVKYRNTGPNYNIQASQGFNIQRKQQEFIGALLSFTYNRNYTFTRGDRYSYEYDLTALQNGITDRGKYSDSIYNEETVLAALANISIKIDGRSTITWKNNLSVNTDNRLIKRTGGGDITSDPAHTFRDVVRWFTSNQIFSSQLGGEHSVGKIKTKINWLASYSKVQREIPNLARTSYAGYLPDLSPVFSSGTISLGSGSGTMFFANSNENIKSFKTDITQPYVFMKNTQNSIKLGGGYQERKRDFTSRYLGFLPYNNGITFDNSLLTLPEDQIFLPAHLGTLAHGQGGFLLTDGTQSNSDYDASSRLTYIYIMNDQRFFKKFRLIYGVRMERFNQKLTSVKNLRDTININTVVTDFLPSVNLVYALTPKINLRACYSQSINRPEFRELAPYLFFDYVTQYTYQGFDTLQRAKINNYDFRFEFFPGKAQLFSVSAFYKDFTNPIEIVSNPQFDNLAIYSNALTANVYGVEAEFRTLLSTLFGIKRENTFLAKLTLAANAAYMKSNVKLGRFGFYDPALLVTNRALQGQSPYLINGSLNFNDEETGLSSTVSVNRVGDRTIIAGTIFDADIYEKARTVVDFQVAKFFVKNILELKFTARDVLAQKLNFYFDMDKSKSFTADDRIFSSGITPRVFTFSATYKF